MTGSRIPHTTIKTGTDRGDPLVSTEKLSVTFKNIHALVDIDFELYPGEVLGLLGDNGAGKSTLVETLMGLHTNYTGNIFVDGIQVDRPTVKIQRNAGMEIAYQKSVVNSFMGIWQNFFLGRELTKKIGPLRLLDKKRMMSITAEFLTNHKIYFPFSVNTPVGRLSGGQRKILSILRAYFYSTRVLILDEPTANLSEHEVEVVLSIVKKARSDGLGVIFVTHKEHEVFEIADRFFILNQGSTYMVLERKYSLLNRISSLLISSRVLAVQDIAAEIALQFSKPINDMRINIEKLRRDFDPENDPELYEELMKTIMSEIESLTSVIYHLSHFSEEPNLMRKEIALRRFIENTVSEIPSHLREKADFQIDVDENLLCYGDKDILKQILLNILHNAIEASGDSGTIAVSAEKAGIFGQQHLGDDSVCIKIRDWGIGMDEYTLQEIFNPFYTTKPANSGLGLSIVHKLLEHEGGALDLSSTPGEGTEFRIYLNR